MNYTLDNGGFFDGPNGLQYYDGLPMMVPGEVFPDGFLPDLTNPYTASNYEGDVKYEVESFLNSTDKGIVEFLRLARVDVDIYKKTVTY